MYKCIYHTHTLSSSGRDLPICMARLIGPV